MRHPVNAAVRRKWNSCHLGTDHTLLKSEKGVISGSRECLISAFEANKTSRNATIVGPCLT